MSTSVSVTPYAAASRRARSVSSALAAPEPKYFAVNAWGGASLASDQLATTAEESRPPLKNAATGTSLTRWARTDSSSQRSEEHTSELQSRFDLVCRLPLEKKSSPTRSTRMYI